MCIQLQMLQYWLPRFNKIYQYCQVRFNSGWQVYKEPFGLWGVHKGCYLGVSRIRRYLSILFLNIFKLFAPTQSAGNLFHSFLVLCEKEYFLTSDLHWSFTNATSCPLVLEPFLIEFFYFCQHYHNHLISWKLLSDPLLISWSSMLSIHILLSILRSCGLSVL